MRSPIHDRAGDAEAGTGQIAWVAAEELLKDRFKTRGLPAWETALIDGGQGAILARKQREVRLGASDITGKNHT
jgi:hypothetical protein